MSVDKSKCAGNTASKSRYISQSKVGGSIVEQANADWNALLGADAQTCSYYTVSYYHRVKVGGNNDY